MALKLLKNTDEGEELKLQQMLLAGIHHQEILDAYIQSHRVRNHSEGTISEQRQILNAYFRSQANFEREPFVWETMEPLEGKRKMRAYAKFLLEREISPRTVRKYLNTLHVFYCFVLEHPWVTVDGAARRIDELYGAIEKPISEFDLPAHSTDVDLFGLPMDPERVYDLLFLLREKYLAKETIVKARNYSLIVLAFETGLRINELYHLEVNRDLLWESEKVQTRFAKASSGSGKKTRQTLFPPLSRETMRYYLKNIRPKFKCSANSDYLFITGKGTAIDKCIGQLALKEMITCAQKNDFPISSDMTWHWTRRIFATRFIERFPEKLHVLIDLLGHQGLAQFIVTFVILKLGWTKKSRQ